MTEQGNSPQINLLKLVQPFLSTSDDFEYAIGVLISYADEDGIEGDVEDALEEIKNNI